MHSIHHGHHVTDVAMKDANFFSCVVQSSMLRRNGRFSSQPWRLLLSRQTMSKADFGSQPSKFC